jgi:hypothetical protein
MKRKLLLLLGVFFCAHTALAGHHQGSSKSFAKQWNRSQQEFMGDDSIGNAKSVNQALYNVIDVARKFPSNAAVLMSALEQNASNKLLEEMQVKGSFNKIRESIDNAEEDLLENGENKNQLALANVDYSDNMDDLLENMSVENSLDTIQVSIDNVKEEFLRKVDILITEITSYFAQESSSQMLKCLNFWINQLNAFRDNVLFGVHEATYKMLLNAFIVQQNKVAQDLEEVAKNSYTRQFENMSNAAYSLLGDIIDSMGGVDSKAIVSTLFTLIGIGGGGLPMLVLQELLTQMLTVLVNNIRPETETTEAFSEQA